jgi:hypothetical protein
MSMVLSLARLLSPTASPKLAKFRKSKQEFNVYALRLLSKNV